MIPYLYGIIMSMSTSLPQHVLITGATGLIGQQFTQFLLEKGISFSVFSHGHQMVPGAVNTLSWDPDFILQSLNSHLSPYIHCLNQCDVIVNLAGAPIASGRLGSDHRDRVLTSRVQSVKALLKLMEASDSPPQLWIQASAIGFYGDTGHQIIDESSNKGRSFLSDVCEAWESALYDGLRALQTPPRVIVARIGMVLSSDSQAWKKIILPIKLGLGGRLGTGDQWWSWIHLEDVIRLFYQFMVQSDMSGTYNLTSPYPVQQRVLTQLVSKRCNRLAIIPTPSWILKLALGDVATELVLPSHRVLPDRLLQMNYSFKYATVERVLDALL